MTPDEILAMAKEAGLTDPDLADWMTDYGNAKDEIIMFAALVATKEREACARIADDAADGIGRIEDDIGASIAKAIRTRGAA